MKTITATALSRQQTADRPVGYRWNAAVLARVMRRHGLTDAAQLLRAAADFDQGNRYLDTHELTAAAELLQRGRVAGYRCDPGVFNKVKRQHHMHSSAALLRQAVAIDDGDHFLSKEELQTAAKRFSDPIEWSSPATTQLYKQPKKLRGWSWSPAVLDEVMQRFGVGDAKALLRAAMRYDNGNRYLDRQELAAAAWQTVEAGRGLTWDTGTVLDVMQQRHIGSASALLATAAGLHVGDRQLTRTELELAADELAQVVPAHDVTEVARRVDSLRGRADVLVTDLTKIDEAPISAIHFPCLGGTPKLRLLITAGVHGNEPAGTAAAMKLAEELAANSDLRQSIEVTIVPLVNPTGMAAGSRRTANDIDLNRVFTDAADAPPEARALAELLQTRRFDLALDLHGAKAKRAGFFALHSGSEALMRSTMLACAATWPVLERESNPYDLSAPGVAASDNEGTLKNLARKHGARWAATIESPASLSYLDQVLGHVDIVQQAIASALLPGAH